MQVPSYTANGQTFNLSIILVFDHFVKYKNHGCMTNVSARYSKTTDQTSTQRKELRHNVILIYS